MLDVDGQPVPTTASSTLLSDEARGETPPPVAFKRGRSEGAFDFGELKRIGLGRFNHLQFKWPSSDYAIPATSLFSRETETEGKQVSQF